MGTQVYLLLPILKWRVGTSIHHSKILPYLVTDQIRIDLDWILYSPSMWNFKKQLPKALNNYKIDWRHSLKYGNGLLFGFHFYLPRSQYLAVCTPGLLILLAISIEEVSVTGPQLGLLCLLRNWGALFSESGQRFIVDDFSSSRRLSSG